MEFSPCYTSDSYIPVCSTGDESAPSTSKMYERSKNSEGCSSTFLKSCKNPPWKKTTVYSCGVIGLHEEINDFFEIMRPTDEESEIRMKVVEHVTCIVHSLWPLAKVEIFGSFRTGLYLPSSDIDMVIIGEWKSIPLSTLSNALQNNGIQRTDIEVIAKATVPIIKLLHSPSGIRVDISFNMTNGVKSAKMLKNLIKEYPVLPQLVFVLKQFLVARDLNEVYNGGMSSYCLTLLIISFLQGYHKQKCKPSVNLGTLLIEFFELYGVNFNYERVSIHFQNGGKYRPRHGVGNFLSVEDPLVEGHDVAKGTYLMHLLKMSFQNAFFILSKAVNESSHRKSSPNSFLHLIFKADNQVLETRQKIKENHFSIIRKLTHSIQSLNVSSIQGPPPSSTPELNSISKRFKKKRFR